MVPLTFADITPRKTSRFLALDRAVGPAPDLPSQTSNPLD